MKTLSLAVEGKSLEISKGTRIRDLFTQKDIIDRHIVAAIVNSRILPLNYPLKTDSSVSFITPTSKEGHQIYVDSLIFLLYKVFSELYPDKTLIVSHSISDGIYFYEENDTITNEMTAEISEKMTEYIMANYTIESEYWVKDEVLSEMKSDKDKVLLAQYSSSFNFLVPSINGYSSISIVPLVLYTLQLKYFSLQYFNSGLILRYPSIHTYPKFRPYNPQSKLFDVYISHKDLMKYMECETVGDLNRHIVNGKAIELILTSEAVQNKKIIEIIDTIKTKPDIRLITIAGPSSSGKTTFSKKLMIHLLSEGFHAFAISLDDYFVNRENTPKDENGEYDFECLESLDIPFFNENMNSLLKNKETDLPYFDFVTGHRKHKGHKHKPKINEIFIIEGIHGLNPKLTYDIDPKYLFKLYISPLTQLNITNMIRIPTTTARLIRRLVRDSRYRGTNAENTLSRWPSVVNGERKNIFPFQDHADMFFNSALLYEQSVLRTFAEPLLKSIQPESSHYAEAQFLLEFILQFVPISEDLVPNISILREFIGSSLYIQNF